MSLCAPATQPSKRGPSTVAPPHTFAFLNPHEAATKTAKRARHFNPRILGQIGTVLFGKEGIMSSPVFGDMPLHQSERRLFPRFVPFLPSSKDVFHGK